MSRKKDGWRSNPSTLNHGESKSIYILFSNRRWFVLTPTHLYTFKYEKVYTNPTESLVLKYCTTVKSAEAEIGVENSFVI